jgi:hypothetical protein
MNVSSALPRTSVSPAPFGAYRFLPGDDAEDSASPKISHFGSPAPREDLPYRVELWDERKMSVEQVLAVTANGSIGFAAYYAAAREYPNRYVTLRHKNSIVSRSNPPKN